MPLLNPNSKSPTLQTPPRLRASAGNPSAISHRSPVKCAPYFTGPSSTLVSRPSTGFTLIELLVVITVIAILAGLVLAAMGGVQKRGARDKAQSEIQSLSAAIEEYHRDRGVFPPTNSNALYAELTTDPTAGHSPTNTAKVYFEPTPTIVNTNTPGRKFFQDPWGNPYGYSNNPAGFFEVWSTFNNSPPNQWIHN